MTEKLRRPEWLRRKIPGRGSTSLVRDALDGGNLHTVCEEAGCPNCAECFGKGTATFLILGGTCTRNCRFCSVTKGTPALPDKAETDAVVSAIRSLGIRFAVITSVTRDDLPDGGASVFVELIAKIRAELPKVKVEVLVPDFAGNIPAIDSVISSLPDVFNHNIETVERVFQEIRPMGNFNRSLELLARAAGNEKGMPVKSGFMVGLGESCEEVEKLLRQLKESGVSIVTIGQYLKPAAQCAEVVEYISPTIFENYKRFAESLGFAAVFSGPLVRSSYMAHEVFDRSHSAAELFQEDLS